MKPLVLLLLLTPTVAGTAARRNPILPAVTGQPTLELVSLSPAAGSRLSADGSLRAQLLYFLPEVDSARYEYVVYTQFLSSLAPGVQTSGSVRPVRLPKGRRVGTITLTLPLRRVWADQVIRHPLSCYYHLARRSSPDDFRLVAHTGPFTFTE